MGVSERKARDFARREQEILTSALALFDRATWETVTVEEIAARAEIGKGTIYKHFAGKDELIARLAMDAERKIAAAMAAVAETPVTQGEPLAGAEAAIQAGCRAAAGLTPAERHVAQYAGRSDFRARLRPETRWAWEALTHGLEEELRRHLRAAAEAELIHDEPAHLYSFGAVTAFKGALTAALQGTLPAAGAEAHYDALSQHILGGLLTKKGRKALRKSPPRAQAA